jgi:hypothetical protein
MRGEAGAKNIIKDRSKLSVDSEFYASSRSGRE